MDRSREAWLWMATTCVVVGAALLGIGAALVAAKPATSHAQWTTTGEASVAYCLLAVGIVCFVLGIRGARFPIIGLSNQAASRRAAIVEGAASVGRTQNETLGSDARVVFLSCAREDAEWQSQFATMLRPIGGRRGVYV